MSGFSLTRRSTGDESSDDVRGPLGFNLLHEPSEPLIDFVFVHGLRGGSRKTWSKTNNLAHYWPKEWLPIDSKFKNVRIHSFGYNSDWGEKGSSVLTIHDFGQALLGGMFTSPYLNALECNTPLVMIGHSMGGVVIKKAFLLAKQDPQFNALARRFHSIFFLATPHRGADSAQLLHNMIKLSFLHNEKAYISDLIPNSGAIQVINDEFRHAYQGLHLWSFFETLSTSVGLIVEKDSAIIGLPGERIQLLNADHRHVCKFDDPVDPNYRTLRNSLASTIDSIEISHLSARIEEERSQMRRLAQYLGGAGRPDADLSAILGKKVPGSCGWINEKASFQDWEDGYDDAPKYYWLCGEPATGKSTVAAHVIDYLEHRNEQCSFFFFKYGDSTRSTMASMLLSLAWQMASASGAVRQALMALCRDEEPLDKADERSIWLKVFMNSIFNVKLKKTHYWIIDALDECTNYNVLFPLLARIPQQYLLRAFLLSRPSSIMEKSLVQERISATTDHNERKNSLLDIKILLDARSQYLPMASEAARTSLVEQLLEKSNGNFLWIALTLRELEETNSEEQVLNTLQSVPVEMDGVYHRILMNISAVPRNVQLAKAILRWVVCAARPLSVSELKEAIKLDIRETPHNLEKDAGTICGHLVYVDSNQRVQIAHQTAKVFLVRDGLQSEFAIVRPQAHARLAEVCLGYLCGDDMRTPRMHRGTAAYRNLDRSVFSHYSIMHFSDHVARSSSSIDGPFIALNSFLRGNVLSWVETIATAQELSPLTQTAKNFKIYLERRAKYRSPLGQEVSNVSAWASDLIYIATRFGKPLLNYPSCIQFLLPSVCPPKSIIYRTFKDYPRSLQLVGLLQTDWDDQLSCIVYPKTQAYCVASCPSHFAVGLSDGSLRIYSESTCQEVLELSNGESVRHLALTNTGSHAAAGSRKKIWLWDLVTGALLWTTTAPDIFLSMGFSVDGTSVLITTRAESVIWLRVEDSAEIDTVQFSDIFDEDQVDENHRQKPAKLSDTYRRPPSLTVLSPELNMLAVAYRARPVTFWDLNESSYVGQLWRNADEFQLSVISLVFNPNPDVSLVAAAYQDGSILTYDPWIQRTCGDTGPVGAMTLGASPDGTILATVDFKGVITLFDFETLRVVYKLTSLEHNVRQIAFSNSGRRFYDVRGDRCSVWEPSVLVRRGNTEDDSSLDFSEEIAPGPETAYSRAPEKKLAITALATHHDGNTIFCGRETGVVFAYSNKTGQPFQELFHHNNKIGIINLEWNQARSRIASVDRAGSLSVRALSPDPKGGFHVTDPVLLCKLTSSTHQMLFNQSGNLFLVSMADRDELWNLETGSMVASHIRNETNGEWSWANHPSQHHHLLLVSGHGFGVFEWETLMEVSSRIGTGFGLPTSVDDAAIGVNYTTRARNICISCIAPRASKEVVASLRFWAANSITLDCAPSECFADYDLLAKDIKAVVGVYRTQLVFLDHSGWICSVDIDNINPTQKSYTRHFFIPFQLLDTSRHTSIVVTTRGSIALAVGDQLAVFHNGLGFEQQIGLAGAPLISAKPSMRSNLKRFSSAPT